MSTTLSKSLGGIPDKLSRLSIRESLEWLAAAYPGEVVFSTSFSVEDQVITHIILENKIPVTIFTLDTGRLFAETYSVWNATNEQYNTHISAYYPDRDHLEPFLNEKGPNAFYESVENRKTCCHIRKVEPLKRALSGKKVWVTGLRAEHSADRNGLQELEWDAGNNFLIKYNPIFTLEHRSRKRIYQGKSYTLQCPSR